MKFSIMPRPSRAKEEDIEKLAFILPEYYKKEGQDSNPGLVE